MTKLNITNKTIYKLKKNKNQSKKNVPKKRKHKKRKQKNGRSFRKRRRKYNIKNNSIKKYKKQRGGVGEIDTKTASIKKKEKEVKQLREIHEAKKNELDEESADIEKFRIRKHKGEDTDKPANEVAQLGVKLEDENNILKRLNTYKEHVKTKLSEQQDKVNGLLNKTIKPIKTSIEKAPNTIKTKNAEIGKLDTGIENAKKKKTALEEREGEIKTKNAEIGKLDTKIKGLKEKKTTLEKDIKAQKTMIPLGMKQVNEAIVAYFNIQVFNKRPNIDELIADNDGKYTPRLPIDHELREKDDDNLQTKINKYKEKLKFPPITDHETYYEKHKNTKLDEIVKLLTEEQKWVNDTIKVITKRKDAVDKQIKDKNLEIKEIADKNEEEISSKKTELFKKKTKNAKIETNIRKKEEDIKEEEAKWKQTQDEASKTIEEGEKVFQDKIKNIAHEDDRTIEDVKKDIEDTKKSLKGLRKNKPEYQKLKTELENVLKTLNGEYDSMTEGKIDKLSKPGLISFPAKKDKYKKDVKNIEKEALEKKKKRIEGKGARTNWAKAGLVASKVLHTKFVLPALAPYISDDMVEDPDTLTEVQEEKAMEETENYRLILNTPYVSGTDDIQYARADKPTKPDYGKPFYNHYLKKTIKTEDKGELKIFEMIEQRKARYIKWLMMKESGETYIEDLTDNIKKFEVSSGLMRNTLKEKIITLTFLAYIISRTDEVYINPLTENPTEEEKKEHEEKLKASKFERAIKDLHKTTIDGKTLFELFCIYVPEYTNTIDKVLTQDVLNSVKKTEHDKVISIGEEDFLNDGLKRFNDYKSNHSDCGVLEENDDNDNYLNIGLSNFSNIDNLKQWTIAEEEDKGENMVAQFKEAQMDMNNAKEEEDKKLKKLVDKIKKIIDDLKIEETEAKIVEMDTQLDTIRAKVTQQKMAMDEGHAKKLEEQKKQYEKQAKKAEQDLAVKEGLLKEQEKDMTNKQEEIEKLQTDLEAQNEGLKTCKEGDAAMRAEFESKKADLEGKINLMKEEKMEMERKMNDLETAKEDAVKVQEELSTKITETEKREESLRKDIEASKTPTEVTEETLIDGAEDDEDNSIDAAFDAMEGDGGLNIDIDEKEPLMIFLTQKNGELEVVTSKLPGNDISSWLMQE